MLTNLILLINQAWKSQYCNDNKKKKRFTETDVLKAKSDTFSVTEVFSDLKEVLLFDQKVTGVFQQ